VTDDDGIAAAMLSLARLAAEETAPTSTQPSTYGAMAGALIDAYLCRHAEIVAPTLLLSGSDAIELGIPHGPAIGAALAHLREAQATGEVTSVAAARELLIEFTQAIDLESQG
jgi:hypothetical protein